MNTRTFLKSLVAVMVAPQILIPRAPDAYHWMSPRIVAPAEWELTPYRVIYLTRNGVAFLREHQPPFPLIHLRNYRVGANGLFERVPAHFVKDEQP